MSNKNLLILFAGIALSLVSLSYSRTVYESNVLGSSDLITGKIGSCEEKLGLNNCYQRVDYRGYPFRILRVRHAEVDGEVTKQTSLAGPRRGGIITSTIFYSGVVWIGTAVVLSVKKRSKN